MKNLVLASTTQFFEWLVNRGTLGVNFGGVLYLLNRCSFSYICIPCLSRHNQKDQIRGKQSTSISRGNMIHPEWVELVRRGSKLKNHRKKTPGKNQENPLFTLNYKENSGFPGFFPGVVAYEKRKLGFSNSSKTFQTRFLQHF